MVINSVPWISLKQAKATAITATATITVHTRGGAAHCWHMLVHSCLKCWVPIAMATYAPDNRWFIETMSTIFTVGGELMQPDIPSNFLRLLAEGESPADASLSLSLTHSLSLSLSLSLSVFLRLTHSLCLSHSLSLWVSVLIFPTFKYDLMWIVAKHCPSWNRTCRRAAHFSLCFYWTTQVCLITLLMCFNSTALKTVVMQVPIIHMHRMGFFVQRDPF